MQALILAAKQVLSWSGEAALPPVHVRRARGAAIATDKRLNDFARLTGRKPATEAASEGLIRRLVGSYIVPDRDTRQDALLARVDAALSDAMRRLLHNPDFQNAEAVWRGAEFLTRRVETDATTQIVLYDISAEELAADLAGCEELDHSALYALLVEQPPMDASQGALSMIIGLYQFEAMPPHADLLGRIAQVAAATGAPFVGGLGSDSLKVPMHEWHPLTRQAWDALRELPASAYLGLATPRFLLRMPYGKKTDPIEAFAFEEFTRESGLSGMLWGHSALLVATLIAKTWQRSSKAMKLGDIATVGDLPVYVYNDADGEQIALPCTERLFSERQALQVVRTGVNPVLSLRGRPEVRLGGFNALSGATLAGRWAPVNVTLPPPSPQGAPAPDTAAMRPEETEGATTLTSPRNRMWTLGGLSRRLPWRLNPPHPRPTISTRFSLALTQGLRRLPPARPSPISTHFWRRLSSGVARSIHLDRDIDPLALFAHARDGRNIPRGADDPRRGDTQPGQFRLDQIAAQIGEVRQHLRTSRGDIGGEDHIRVAALVRPGRGSADHRMCIVVQQSRPLPEEHAKPG